MKYPKKQKARTLLTEFSSTLGSDILRVRIFRDSEAFVCEREFMGRDGTSFTMVLPVRGTEAARGQVMSHPDYPRVRGEVWRLLGRLENSLQKHDGNRVC